MNAVNLIDGIDGLATLLGFLISSFFGAFFFWWDQVPYAVLCFAVAGSLSAFFFYNVFGRENKIFMGDTGSLILGCLFAIFIIKFNEFTLSGSEMMNSSSPAISMAVISIPLFDMLRVFALRILQGKSPFYPDKNHIHHKLLSLGYSHIKSSLILFASTIVLIAITFSFSNMNNNIQLGVLVLFAALFSSIPGLIMKHRRSSGSLSSVSPKLSVKMTTVSDISIPKFDLLEEFYLEGNRNKKDVKKTHYSSSKIREEEMEMEKIS